MISHTTGDIFEARVQALVNTVNCVGVMGRGIALQFKRRYPPNFEDYQRACADGHLVPGRMLVHDRGSAAEPRYIINFPTKRHWRNRSRIEDIRTGLVALATAVDEHEISSIAVPPLGCGLGGLAWETVRPLIAAAFSDVADRIDVLIYEPVESRDLPGVGRDHRRTAP